MDLHPRDITLLMGLAVVVLWGIVTAAVAVAMIGVPQALFLHVFLVAGFVARRRARTSPPR